VNLSVEAFCTYLGSVKAENTVLTYRQGANHLITYVQKQSIDIRQTPGLLFGFVDYLRGRGIGRSLRAYVPGAIRYLEWRRAMGDPLPVFAKPDFPKRVRGRPIVLQAAAMRQYMMISASSDEPFRTIALLYPFSGLRADEMLRLELGQVVRDLGDPKGHRLCFAGVSGKSAEDRDVQIIDPGSKILFGYLTGWRRAVRASRWLFPSEKDWNRPYADRTMRHKMDAIEAACGGERLSARIIRHTWATALADSGMPLHHVAQLAGHQSIQTTYKHYIGPASKTAIGKELDKVKLFQEEGSK
jgi:site-specific recombinase XerD